MEMNGKLNHQDETDASNKRNLTAQFGPHTHLTESAKKEFCSYWTSASSEEESKVDYVKLREQIVKMCSTPKKYGVFAFSSKNFAPSEITEERVLFLFSCIDRFFFQGTLQNFLTNSSCGHFGFEVCDQFTEKATKSSLAFFANSLYKVDYQQLKLRNKEANDQECPIIEDSKSFFGIRIQRRFWGPSARHRIVDGVVHDNKLSAFVALLCHELTHTINYIVCQDGSHSKKFRQMNASFFGHSSREYFSKDY